MQLLKYEAKKILIKQYGLFLFAAVILIRLISLPSQLNINYGFNTYADKNAYLEMLKPLSGTLTEEKEEKIVNMKEQLLDAQNIRSQCLEALQNGDLETYDDLYKELEQYIDILKNENSIERIFKQYSYVCEDRENRALIPVKNVGVMENASVNYMFLLCICFCCTYAIMVEQRGKAEVIIRTSPNGQGKTMAAKIEVLFLTIGVSSLILSATDLSVLSAQLPSEYWHYGVSCLESFKNCPVKISISCVFVLVQLVRLLGVLFIASAAMLTAHFSRSYTAGIFPYAAIPIIIDYISEGDSQSYYLPTGLLKGWGYFYGDMASPYDENLITFHSIPLVFTLLLIFFSLLFVIGSVILLIQSGKNRLSCKHGKIAKAALLGAVLMLFSSCSAQNPKVIDEYDGSISVYPTRIAQNSRYKFNVETLSYTNSQGEEYSTDTLNITNKETGKAEVYPFSPFMEEQRTIDYLFACEDQLLFSCNNTIMRIDLEDFSLTTLYSTKGGSKRIVFGLAFDLAEDHEEFMFSPNGAFTDGKTTFIYNESSGIAKLRFDGSLEFLVSDDFSGGLEYDGKALYYISSDNMLHKYDIEKGKDIVIYDKEIVRYSLKGDRDSLYFQSYGMEIVLDKADLK